MLKSQIKAPSFGGNVALGSTPTLTLDAGPRYHIVLQIASITKTAPTSGFTSATLSDVMGLIVGKVNTVAKRQHTAQELNEVQSALANVLAVHKYDGVDNDLVTTVADTTATYNSIACTTRRTTFVLAIMLAEPSRDSYYWRQFFAWPTSWVLNGKIVQTANVQFDVSIPNNTTAGLSRTNISSAMAAGSELFESPAIRAEIVTDNVSGSFAADNVTPTMQIMHWFRQPVGYSSTTPVVRTWPFTGYVSQMSIFSPNGNGVPGDDIASLTIKKNQVEIKDCTKRVNDSTNGTYNWNPKRIGQNGYSVATAVIHSGNAGSSYAVGDLLTCLNGSVAEGGKGMVLQVATVSSGAIATLSIVEGGLYSLPPDATVDVFGGTGTGAKVDLTYAGLSASPFDIAGTNWPATDVTHVAFDFDDDPTSALQIQATDIFEVALTLTQNTADDASLVFLTQVWRDAFAA